ncbi:hypothetical protein J3A83DRAFT_4367135 [Scleroderma citrinum]
MTKPELYPNSKSVVDWMLVYYHFNLASSDKRSWVNRPTTKADTLVGVGKTPRSGWKEWLVDWMEFEELTWQAGSVSRGDDKTQRRLPEIPLNYLSSVDFELSIPTLNPTIRSSLSQLRRLLSTREARHRSGFYLWILIVPLTSPLTIIRESIVQGLNSPSLWA